MRGLVLETHNRMYRVGVDGHILLCQPKGDIRRNSNLDYRLPVIGDQVELVKRKQKGRGIQGLIIKIHGRKNQFARVTNSRLGRTQIMASNLDRVFIVSALTRPGIQWGMIDRYLVYCELHQIQPILIMNKIDLDPQWELDELVIYYRNLGYQLYGVSAKFQKGLDDFQKISRKGISLLTGASGVGKSSLINAVCPQVSLAVQEVSEKSGLGKHTTSNSILIPTVEGGYIADSPGIREFIPPPEHLDDIRFGFREFLSHQSNCQFSNCLHINEPKCGVRAAVGKDIHQTRYLSYLALVNEIREIENARPAGL
ncbi:MAG: ribosome small subunit-dependent GTPase A [Acidobacteria bacterium]|nr:MAG: ribosome small subunit-dependent GTPase A [Acidobacteriota bacterium]PIE89729.1 MAG: ribosome small subunit-dependent GTPase A [Acidobacteriota bacterium]